VLPRDVARALSSASDEEEAPFAKCALSQLIENERIARCDYVPICQDTGTVWVCLEIGSDIEVAGDVLSRVDEAVGEAYEAAHLRKSVVVDALVNRANTTTNAPAFAEIKMVDEPGVARLHIMLKGGGSDNASRVTMLVPGAGRRGIIDEVLDCVRAKGANACPPLVIGIGIGATFDKVAGLAKHALMREIGTPSKDSEVAAFERELLEAVNASGVGAGGLGGSHTALAVHIETAPCHIAALPLAINMGCSALRRCTIDLTEKESFNECIQEGSSNVPDENDEAQSPIIDGGKAGELDAISLSAAKAQDGTVHIAAVNRDLEKEYTIKLDSRIAGEEKLVKVTTLTGESPRATCSLERSCVKEEVAEVAAAGIILRAGSINLITVTADKLRL